MEVTTERASPPASVHRSSTAAVADNEPPPKPAAPPVNPSTISANTIILNIQGGDTYCRAETHIYVHQSPAPKVKERMGIHGDAEPSRQVAEECERMAREHRERVRRWRESPFQR